jgi:CDP-4-dehydro-6-deoxyglucose reductase, E1
MSKKEQILKLVSEYINEKHSEKKWEPGKDWVQYAGPYYTSDEFVAGVSSLLNEWLVMGTDSIKFENKFSHHLGRNFGILTNSGSSSNLIMMSVMTSKRSYNFPKGTRVITPIAGFPTTINSIFQVGFKPWFVDIELNTLNLNLDQVEVAAKAGAKIITFAHVLGNPPNMDRLMEIVDKYNLILLEDCCDALGSTYNGRLLGSFGKMSTCSFYPAHHMTMGEGGFVATENKELETIARSFREWGRGCYCVGKKANLLKNGSCGCRFNNWLPSLPEEIFDHKYVYDEIGFNLKPIELQASMGLEQLKKLPEIHYLRKRNHSLLLEAFKPHEEFFILPKATELSDPSWFAFAVTVKDGSPFKRKDIVNYFENNKIQTRPYFAGNIMLHPGYNHLMNSEAVLSFENARKVTTDTFFIGTSPVITIDQINYIKETLNSFIKHELHIG